MFNVFVTGLNKGCGKTLFISGLAATMQSLGYTTSVYKPIQLGATNLSAFKKSPDLEMIKYFDSNIKTKTTYLFNSANTPFVSSYEDNIKVDLEMIKHDFIEFNVEKDFLFVEGTNSIISPIVSNYTETNLIKDFNMPIIIVANIRQSSIDEILLGIEYVKSQRLQILGVVLNCYNENSANLEKKYYKQIFEEFSDIPILGVLPFYENIVNIKPETIISDILSNFDLEKLFNMKISKLN